MDEHAENTVTAEETEVKETDSEVDKAEETENSGNGENTGSAESNESSSETEKAEEPESGGNPENSGIGENSGNGENTVNSRDAANKNEKAVETPPENSTEENAGGTENTEQDDTDFSPENQISALRKELDSLKEQLTQREKALERITEECEEFADLYPGQPISSLGSEVWEGVKKGIPLAASYAYSLAKKRRREQEAAQINDRNRDTSSGNVKGQQNNYFSPGEVRSMSARQVRENYSKIIDSMKSWN